MKQIILSLVVMYAVIMTAACPADKVSVVKAQNASAKLASAANEGIEVTRQLFNSKIITIEQKDAVAKAFIALAEGGIIFDTAVKNAVAVYGNDVPPSEVAALFAIFDDKVIGQFLDVLEKLKVLSDASEYKVTVALLRTAILTVANAFGKKAAVAAQIGGK